MAGQSTRGSVAVLLGRSALEQDRDGRVGSSGTRWPPLPRPVPRAPRWRRRSTPRSRGSREGVLSGQGPADDELLDLARTLVQRGHAGVAEELPHRIPVDVAVAAVDLARGGRG